MGETPEPAEFPLQAKKALRARQTLWRWALLSALLIAETEYLLDTHYTERTAVRALVQLPLYHMLLAFLAFAVLIRVLGSGRLPGLPDFRLSRGWLIAHVLGALGLNFSITPLWNLTSNQPEWNWTWLLVIGAYFGSWLASLVPPSQWWPTIRLHVPWMVMAIVLGCLALGAASAAERLWVPLAAGTFYLSRTLLQFFFLEVIARPEDLSIGTPVFSARIEAGCSGLEGLGLVGSYTLAFLWLRRADLRFPQAFWLLPAGLITIWLCNSIRVALLVLIGTYISPSIAVRGFHSQAGWIAFTVIGLSCIFGVEKFGWFRKESTRSTVEYPAGPFLLPIGALLFGWMLCQAFSSDFDLFYPLRVALVVFVLWRCYPGYRDLLAQPPTWSAGLVGVAVYFLWVALVPRGEGVDPLQRLPDLLVAIWLPFRVIGAVLIIPLIEELAFRGYLLRRLQGVHFEKIPVGHLTAFSLVLSSLAFGALHQQWLAGTVAGLAYGLATRSRAGLTDAVVAHGVTNLCLAVQVLVQGDWWLW